MKKNFLISTGGSGGHVIPATILYEHLSKNNNVIISTDKRGLKFLDKDIYDFEIIDTPKLNNIFFFPLNFFLIIYLIFKSIFLLKNKKIDKIFSTGGYMSLPVIFAGRLLNLSIFLVEPNLVLGRSNKYFLNSCKKIFCYNKQIKNFPEKFQSKIVKIDPLVRENIYKLKDNKKETDKFTILIVGGSQGAKVFDENLKDLIVKISKKNDFRVIQQTSENNISILSNFYIKNNIDNKIFSFTNDFANLIQQADLCITRAGASTLAELSVLNIPFIAVPLPSSKDNHQFENANFYRENDCCWLIEQIFLQKGIEEILDDIFIDKNGYKKKKENLIKLNYQNTWNNVNQKIKQTIDEN